MRVMTFNILHGLDYKNKIIDLDLFISSIKKYRADVCGLNEVRGEGPLDGYTDQTNALGDGLGFSRYFGEAIKVDGTSPYGNAILSRYPFKSVETVLIPDPDDKNEESYFETRCVIKAVADVDGTDICFLVCHMGLMESERKNAVKTLCKILDEIKSPLILMGDFNTEPQDPVLAPLFERLEDTCNKAAEKTFPSDNPRVKIDYILYKGLECVDVTTVKEVISDHLPIFADFKLNK